MSNSVNPAPCKKCGNFAYGLSHKCPPTWRCYFVDHDGPEFADEVYADDEEEAAIKFCQAQDECPDKPDDVIVIAADGTESRWEMSSEYTRDFYSHKAPG